MLLLVFRRLENSLWIIASEVLKHYLLFELSIIVTVFPNCAPVFWRYNSILLTFVGLHSTIVDRSRASQMPGNVQEGSGSSIAQQALSELIEIIEQQVENL